MRFRIAPMAGLLLVTLALAGCTSAATVSDDSAGAVTPTSSAPSSPSPMPTPEPSSAPMDPADVTAWMISGTGIGPIERGAEYPDVVDGVTGFEASEWCAGIPVLERDETTRIVLGLSDDGTQVSNMWVMSQLRDGSASPATAAGIRLGSSAAELTAAYPDLSLLVQRGADTWVYVLEDGPGAWIGFVVDAEAVVMIGVSDQRSVPKEWCS